MRQREKGREGSEDVKIITKISKSKIRYGINDSMEQMEV